MSNVSPSLPETKRCAIYTRKSTAMGLEQEFNSLDAQREACERYIQCQAVRGWEWGTERYDDGGFTGKNLARPALQRLMDDVHDGNIDIVVVYKVDRLSRSLLDFAQVMDQFHRAGVDFVSVTQNFSTADAMGRLTLNMLMSFAEFEREMIAERRTNPRQNRRGPKARQMDRRTRPTRLRRPRQATRDQRPRGDCGPRTVRSVRTAPIGPYRRQAAPSGRPSHQTPPS